jgi:EpsI family protein
MLSPFARRAIILAALMLGTSVLTAALTPKKHVANLAEQPNLEDIIPHQFGDWKEVETLAQAVVNPQTKETLDKIYSQVLSRTYINSAGRRIMLSLAYGTDQSSDNRIHRPEVCYPSQGFQLLKKRDDVVLARSIALPVMRIETQLGNRHEPVTYWIRIGESLAKGAFEQFFARLSYGFRGYTPDGILFRVSEINPDIENSYILQDQFIQTLLDSLTPSALKMLIGSSTAKLESHHNG